MIVAAPKPLEGVFLFLGFSRKDARVVMAGREKVSDRLPSTEQEEQLEVLSTVQQAVSYFTSNNNKVSPVWLTSHSTVILSLTARSISLRRAGRTT